MPKPKKKTDSVHDPAPRATVPSRRRTTRRPAAAQEAASGSGPSYEQIAEAAYLRYLQRGGQHGQDFDDWVEAERSLKLRGA